MRKTFSDTIEALYLQRDYKSIQFVTYISEKYFDNSEAISIGYAVKFLESSDKKRLVGIVREAFELETI